MALESKLWQDVNALGGVPSNDYERGFNDAIGKALERIEAAVTTKAVMALTDEGYVWIEVPVEVETDASGKIISERFIQAIQPAAVKALEETK